nr:hypothetical protein Iba_chr12aCG13300 [Ipomoea batatas]
MKPGTESRGCWETPSPVSRRSALCREPQRAPPCFTSGGRESPAFFLRRLKVSQHQAATSREEGQSRHLATGFVADREAARGRGEGGPSPPKLQGCRLRLAGHRRAPPYCCIVELHHRSSSTPLLLERSAERSSRNHHLTSVSHLPRLSIRHPLLARPTATNNNEGLQQVASILRYHVVVSLANTTAVAGSIGEGLRPQQRSGTAWRQSLLPCSSSSTIVTQRLSRNRAGESSGRAQRHFPLRSPSGGARQRWCISDGASTSPSSFNGETACGDGLGSSTRGKGNRPA